MLRDKTRKSKVSGVSLMENHILAFAYEKKVHWSLIQRLSFTTQKWMKQLNSKNFIVFICLEFCIIFLCRILCKLFYIIFNSPYKLALSFFLYRAQKHESCKFVLENRTNVGLQRNISKMSAAYSMLSFNWPYQSSLQFKGSTGFSLADNI